MKFRSSFILGLMAVLGVILLSSSHVRAISGSDFKAGNIIDDAVFYNAKSMTAAQVQTFLNSKVKTCDTQGSQPYGSTGKTVREYWTPKGEPAPYTCLKDYKQKTPAMDAESGICSYIPAYTSRTAAQIIANIASACNISPKVLLVLLEKEQSLVTDTSPLKNLQYANATGFACPDTAPCNPEYEGFFYQVYYAARQFQLYQANPNNYNYIAGQSNKIYYNPDFSCGYSWVRIENQATASLYNYTPYQPNPATLKVGLGQTAPCGAYGNKNFWWIFTAWFGSTHSNITFTSMKSPRWMQLKDDTSKINPYTKESVDTVLPTGKMIYFTDAISVGGVKYLRTQHDSDQYLNKGIPLNMLDEVHISYTSLKIPRWLQTSRTLYKIDLRTGKKVGNALPSGTKLFFPTLTNFNGKMYLRTQADTYSGAETGIAYEALSDTTIEYKNLKQPRWFVTTNDTRSYDLKYPSGTTASVIPKGTKMYFDHSVSINGKLYTTKDTPPDGTYVGVPLDHLRNIEPGDFNGMKHQRAYKTTEVIQKIDLATNLPTTGEPIAADTTIYFQTAITLDGVTYLRSVHDAVNYNTTVIPLTALAPVDVVFNDMKSPRRLRLRINVRKIDPVTKLKLDGVLKKGTSLAFSQSIMINGAQYLRTTSDVLHGHYKVIPFSVLKEM